MFDAGIFEMLLIGLIALLVIGPERLPGVAAGVGKWVGKARTMVASARSDIEREIHAEELRNMVKQQETDIQALREQFAKGAEQAFRGVQSVKDEVEQVADKASDTLQSVKQDITKDV